MAEMSTLTALAIGLLAILSLAVFLRSGPAPGPVAIGVGTRPGDVGTRLDDDKAARARGNELAMFGAG